MTPYSTLLVSAPAPGVALIRLHRPEAANAINGLLAKELRDAVAACAGDAAIRCLILAGAGKAFCAGADLKERRGMDEVAWDAQHHAFEAMLEAVRACPKPVIAAVNGAAYGGGLELALACDFIYAGDNARFALTEATLGIMPGLGGTQALPRAIGRGRALEMLFTGLPCTAAEACEWGLVNRLFSSEVQSDGTVLHPDLVVEEAIRTAMRIAASAPLSVQAIKRSVHAGAHMPLEQALACEMEEYRKLIPTQDRREGINAFNEKRKPVFGGV